MNKLLRHFTPATVIRWINWWPPLLGAGIRVTHFAESECRIEVSLRRTWYNTNYLGSHFGGSLYAMCDPFLVFLMLKRLGKGYIVWDQAAEIQFIKPGRGTVRVKFHISQEQAEAVRAEADAGQRVRPVFEAEVIADSGEVVARVKKTLYVRRA